MQHWSEHTIWWHVYPLGFTGAPVRPTPKERVLTHRLRHIAEHLDYLIELGCNGLALGPIFSSNTHGYDTVDYFEIDPRLGDIDDFHALVGGCKQRGIHIMLDGVFNHVGTGSKYQHLVREGAVFEGHGDLVTLNHDSPEVVELVAHVMNYWLEQGIDSWRLDAAYSMPTSFWEQVAPLVYAQHPEAWIMGEVIHGDYSAYAAPINSVTQYELWKAIWSSLKDDNFFELDWNLKRHNDFCDSFTPYTFIGNHDVTRIVTQVGAPKSALALTVLMTVAGIPAIYYGDEQGLEGTKEERLGGDDVIRPFFDARQPGNPATLELHQRLIAFRRRHDWLSTSRTHTIELSNTQLHYRSVNPTDESRWVEVSLSLENAPHAEIWAADGENLQVSLT